MVIQQVFLNLNSTRWTELCQCVGEKNRTKIIYYNWENFVEFVILKNVDVSYNFTLAGFSLNWVVICIKINKIDVSVSN